jgi:hypothetical protein
VAACTTARSEARVAGGGRRSRASLRRCRGPGRLRPGRRRARGSYLPRRQRRHATRSGGGRGDGAVPAPPTCCQSPRADDRSARSPTAVRHGEDPRAPARHRCSVCGDGRWAGSPSCVYLRDKPDVLAGRSGRLEDRFELVKLAAHASADLVAELEHAGVTDGVARAGAFLGAGHHARGVKDAEVF